MWLRTERRPPGTSCRKKRRHNTVGVVRPEQEIRKGLQFDLLLGVLNRVGTVADVAADSEGKVATDRTCNVGGRRIIVLELGSSQNLEVVTNREKRPAGWLRRASNGPS